MNDDAAELEGRSPIQGQEHFEVHRRVDFVRASTSTNEIPAFQMECQDPRLRDEFCRLRATVLMLAARTRTIDGFVAEGIREEMFDCKTTMQRKGEREASVHAVTYDDPRAIPTSQRFLCFGAKDVPIRRGMLQHRVPRDAWHELGIQEIVFIASVASVQERLKSLVRVVLGEVIERSRVVPVSACEHSVR